MTAAKWIESRGARVHVEGGNLILEGLAVLGHDGAAEVVAYARQNKAQLLEELRRPPGLPARPCLGCGKLYAPSHEASVYCRAKCFNTPRRAL